MNMRDKICLVTGATSGIGAATALGLARLGAAVVLVGRDGGKCARTARRIRRRTGNPAVEFLVADLASQREIRRIAREFQARHGRLDVLVNNAGGYFRTRQLSAEGLEMTFALNHLAYFLLTDLLLGSLRASPSPRVVNVASEDHRQGRIDFGDPMAEGRYDRKAAYAQSKLANLLFTFELARRTRGTGLAVNALCPGSVRTQLGANNGWMRKQLQNLLSRGRISPEEGADTPVYLASSPEVEGVTGGYFRRRRACTPSEAALDEAAAERLWRLSAALTAAPAADGGGRAL